MKTHHATLFLTALPDGRVDVTLHMHTHRGRPERIGQRVTIAPWSSVLSMFSPADDCRVIVRAEAPAAAEPTIPAAAMRRFNNRHED
jgi:hypothetical protein